MTLGGIITKAQMTYPTDLIGSSADLVRAQAAGWHTMRSQAICELGFVAWDRCEPNEVIAACGDWLLGGGVHKKAGVPLRYTGFAVAMEGKPAEEKLMAVGDRVEVQLCFGQPGGKTAAIFAPCEVLEAEIAATSATFVYGTLPGHPECGEERFHLQHISTGPDSGFLVATVSAFSVADAWYTALGGPVARGVQKLFAGRYARAMLAPVAGGSLVGGLE